MMLFTELFNANKDVRHVGAMISRMRNDVKKILHFDGNHTLKSVFHSRQEAGYYVGAALRLHRVVIELEDTSNLGNGAYNMAQLRRLYAVRVMGAANVGIATLVHAYT
ncbi:hypothetical protein JG688_00010742 [Phytophthora aleatoria]|uniref:Uncharacterized protein n=1 Tax=Phytophthora aleatoria TaxID=2496075 RepID=A0A8J5MFC4_9STRA|nr:hypothetical protein JG688_00010742 [Phytophthora aleatoria]